MRRLIPDSLRQLVGDVHHFAGRRKSLSAFALMLLGASLEGAGLAMLVPIVALLTDAGARGAPTTALVFAEFGVGSPLGQLAILLCGFVVILMIRAIVLMARDRSLNELQIGYVEYARLRLLKAVADADWERVASMRHARVVNALTNDIQRLAGAAQFLLQTLVSPIMLIVQLALTLFLVPAVGFAALLVIIVGALRLPVSYRRGIGQGSMVGEAQLGLTEMAGRLLGGLKAASAENVQGAFVTAFAATSTAMSQRQLVYQRGLTRFRVMVSTGVALAGAAVLLLGYWAEGASASLLASLIIVSRMAAPAVAIHQNFERLASLLPAHGEIRRLEQELQAGWRAHGASSSSDVSGAIALDGVSYVHSDGGGIRDLTLTIAPGEFVGIVGPSGSGKTTLIDLFASLILPQSGEMRIGENRLDFDLVPSWRRRIAYVGQDAFLINDTIRANLSWGREELDDQQLWHALEQAEIAGQIRAMPAGLQTFVAERGARVSGGERQRIALARALLRSPALLILDEATNAIDVATEARIMATLASMEPRPIIVVVSHRAETLRRCTRLLTVEDGRLIADDRLEDGSPRPETGVQ